MSWEDDLTTKIINRLPRNVKLAEMMNTSPATQSRRTLCSYPKWFPELIKILDIAGYEIKRKPSVWD